VITVRDGGAADRDFVIDTARRFAAFGPPPWRPAEDVVAGEVRCLEAFFDGTLTGPVLVVAEEAGVSLGFGFFEPAIDYFTDRPDGHIGMVAVTAAAEGRGAGAALMRAAEEWARRNGYPRLHLNVFEGNARARRFYERLGYAVETVRYVKVIEQGAKHQIESRSTS
jgi:GNAT superfamily N-acetyltransferase